MSNGLVEVIEEIELKELLQDARNTIWQKLENDFDNYTNNFICSKDIFWFAENRSQDDWNVIVRLDKLLMEM